MMPQRGNNGADGGNRRAGIFPDPFAGIGGFGFDNSMIQDFIGRDPFDDPFFRAPFGTFPLFGPRHEGGFLEPQPHQERARRGPIIEEIEGDHHISSSRSQEPIVEHPDEESRTGRNRSSISSRSRRGQQQAPGDGFVHSYSFQSSSFSSGGPNGKFYASSSSRSAGPNGVVLEEHFEKDSSSKTESHRVSKGIYDKGHSVTRKRNAEGREENMETLHNLEEAEISEFDKRWESEADRNLPGWNRNRARTLEGHGGGSRQRAALPNSSWSGARNA